MKRILSAALILTLCAGAFAASSPSKVNTKTDSKNHAGVPDWISGKPAAFPERLYLTGVGTGSDENTASEDAKSDLIKSLTQNVEVIEKVKIYADNSNDISIYTQDVNASSDIKKLSGLKVAEFYKTEEGRVYALAVLKRQDAADYYAKLISKDDTAIAEYMKEARKVPNTIKGCIYAHNALVLAKEIEYYNFLIDVIKPVFPVDISLSYGNYVQLYKETQEIKQQISISISVEGDEKNIVKTAFAEAFEKLGIPTSKGDSSDYSVKAVVSLEKVESPDEQHVFYNYIISADLSSDNKVVLTYSNYGRAGHINDQGAKNKAILTAAKDVKTGFYSTLCREFDSDR